MQRQTKHTEVKIYHGSRENDFKDMLLAIFKRITIRKRYMDILTDESSMKIYDQVFTSKGVNPNYNYEVFEQLGDITANKFIVWYMYRRFPQLFCPSGVKIVARLKINYCSGSFFASIAKKLNFWTFISRAIKNDDTGSKNRSIMEDVFEAFIGATEYILDNRTVVGVGNAIVYDILVSIFDEENISLKYEDLYDAKSILKETFDAYPNIGTHTYIDVERDVYDSITNTQNKMFVSKLYFVPTGVQKLPIKNSDGVLRHRKDWNHIGTGTAITKADAEKIAAAQGLSYLKKKGIEKPVTKKQDLLC